MSLKLRYDTLVSDVIPEPENIKFVDVCFPRAIMMMTMIRIKVRKAMTT